MLTPEREAFLREAVEQEMVHKLPAITVARELFAALDATRARLAEVDGELSACKTEPGGCAYWKESARLREKERDRALERVEKLREALEQYTRCGENDVWINGLNYAGRALAADDQLAK